MWSASFWSVMKFVQIPKSKRSNSCSWNSECYFAYWKRAWQSPLLTDCFELYWDSRVVWVLLAFYIFISDRPGHRVCFGCFVVNTCLFRSFPQLSCLVSKQIFNWCIYDENLASCAGVFAAAVVVPRGFWPRCPESLRCKPFILASQPASKRAKPAVPTGLILKTAKYGNLEGQLWRNRKSSPW